MNYETLKQQHRRVRDSYPADLNLRIHRALSWLKRAEISDDDDGRFIFLWIAFNAAYATEISDSYRLSEQEAFKGFLEKLCLLDDAKLIDGLVWKEYAGSIRVLLDTPFVFQSFWDFHCGKMSEEEWTQRFEKGKNGPSSIGQRQYPDLAGTDLQQVVHPAQPVDPRKGNLEQLNQPQAVA